MKKVNIISLGQFCQDAFTGRMGTLRMFNVFSNGNVYYLFQPNVVDPETGKPVECSWLTPDRVKETDSTVLKSEFVELPMDLLGRKVEGVHLPIKGTVTQLEYHRNGCVHLVVQPEGTQKNGKAIECFNFDLRDLRWEGMEEKTAEELEEDRRKNQSPEFHPCHPRM